MFVHQSVCKSITINTLIKTFVWEASVSYKYWRESTYTSSSGNTLSTGRNGSFSRRYFLTHETQPSDYQLTVARLENIGDQSIV